MLYPERSDLGDSKAFAKVSRKFELMGLNVETVTTAEGSPMTGLTVAEAERRGDGRLFIVHITGADGVALPRPAPTERLSPGAQVTVVTRQGGSHYALFTTRAEVRVGLNVF